MDYVSDELRAAYPACPEALKCCEQPDRQQMWETAREEDHSPEIIVRLMIELTSRMAIVYESLEKMSPVAARVFANLLAEFRTPDFLRYVKAKLGAV